MSKYAASDFGEGLDVEELIDTETPKNTGKSMEIREFDEYFGFTARNFFIPAEITRNISEHGSKPHCFLGHALRILLFVMNVCKVLYVT